MKNIKQAVEHFLFKLNPKNNIWKATESDINGIKKIAEYVENQQNEVYKNNQLFGKLYVIYYGELLKYYNGTVFDKIPQKELHKELNKSFDRILEEFIDKHQTIELNLQIPKEHRNKHPLELKRLGIETKEVEKLDKKDTENNLISMINYALNEYSR
jgi:hypothetical protein